MGATETRQRNADVAAFYDDIEVYPSQLSYRAGETAALHVSCRTDDGQPHAPTYDVVVERWGATRETMFTVSGVHGDFYPPPSDADSRGCGWPVGVEIPIGEDWRSGFYLVTCTMQGSQPGFDTAHAGFVVRPTTPGADMLFVLGTNTWNAYNTWGGCSLYTGEHIVSFRRPFARGMLCRPELERDDRKARPNRWGEAREIDGETYTAWRTREGYIGGVGSAGWFTYERRFAEWAESHGYEFDYAISSDLDAEFTADSSALDGYRHVVSVGHDEYWSAPQRDALERHLRNGGRFSSFSGNTMFWQVRLEGDGRPEADPRSRMFGFKYASTTDDPVIGTDRQHEMSGMWADPLVDRPESAVLGAASAWGLYSRWGNAVKWGSGAFTVYRHDHWIFADTGLGYGDLLGAHDQVVGYETLGCKLTLDDWQLPIAASGDNYPAGIDPADIEVVALTPSSNLGMGDYPSSISATSDQGDVEYLVTRLDGGITPDTVKKRKTGNAVMLVCWPFGRDAGEVVTIGTTDWVFGLGDGEIAQVTHNVLRR